VDRVTTIGNRQKRYRLYENDCRLVGNLPGFIINLLIGDYNIVLIDISNSNLKSVIFKIGNAFIKTIRLQGSVRDFGYDYVPKIDEGWEPVLLRIEE
jgi:hypothetical protein